MTKDSLEIDANHPRCAVLTTPDGERRRVFLKSNRSPGRMAEEIASLELLHAQAADFPAPHIYGILPTGEEAQLVMTYLAGVNLCDLLPAAPGAPPLPDWYQPEIPPDPLPPLPDLLPLWTDIGQAVRRLHTVKTGLYGKLAGDNPNPHRTQGRDFTRHEIHYHLELARSKGHISPALQTAVTAWADQRLDLVAQDEPACLIHFDLHTGNIRATHDGDRWRLAALFDFELARGWLAEYDLAGLQWFVRDYLGAAAGEFAWAAFTQGYGPIDVGRLQLFEVMRAFSAIAFQERYPTWGRWCLGKVDQTLQVAKNGC
jgi:fructosamine-3-kinase